MLKNLHVMQNDLRHWQSLPTMVGHVNVDGFWTQAARIQFASDNLLKVSPSIQLVRFEDGEVYIHDGHHRCASTKRWVTTFLLKSRQVRDDRRGVTKPLLE